MHRPIIRQQIALLVISLFSIAFANVSLAKQIIYPDNKNFVYTGRVDFSDTKAPLISWPGTSIKANFTGEELSIILDDQKGLNFFSVIVDGDDHSPYVIKANQGKHSYVISQSLGLGTHSVEIYKRTEGEEGSTLFKGIEIADQGQLLAPPKRPTRKIEIYGDSITSGMGNEAAHNGPDHLASEKNNYWAYGAITARALEAELHTISQSGIGVMISWFDFIMPQFYDQINADGNNNSQWNFSQWTPDVVVINLMQNDSWLIDNEKRLQPIPSDEQRIAHYQDFVSSIRSKYPSAQLICAMGSMDATKIEKWPNYVRKAVANLKEKGDNKIDTIFFEFTGYGAHPRVAQHKANAKKLTAFIRSKMNW
ncbi:GDSL-type esterase/lipase family protein [Paraglaciecola aquimarina]|uniref:GDSL-type esterase/lipase family protein n=1 Tax=Paraglaciecola algarum TaxID=3050085 RepID=A0ABS9D397_9ALTE|nr:SGNH/GDSL hydrolase family protein [Paraglaciecola sp. G1-23]MCF2947104.1 GDSL-type esterase/lipase family protein [Paraglaciecola sp. G1-23]